MGNIDRRAFVKPSAAASPLASCCRSRPHASVMHEPKKQMGTVARGGGQAEPH